MTLAADNSLPLPALPRPAGKVAPLVFRQKEPAKPKSRGRLGDVIDSALLRAQFFSLWAQRGLGIMRPRTLDASLLHDGLTLVLPGIESESVHTYGMCDGLHEGGVKGAIRVFNWGLPFPGGYLSNLTRIDRNRRRAADLAREICMYQDGHPGKPVNLVAQSGGAGVAVFAAEAMPAGRCVESIVLLGGALSPEYNLAKALRHVRRGILNSYSHKDVLVLNWGTRIFGTIDRKFTPACGCVGFRMPEGLDAQEQALYENKLTQLAWRKELADDVHHLGGHFSSGCETYLARHIAPWMMA